MPSRKGSRRKGSRRRGSRKISHRKGSRKGRKPMKRSLRFMPKLVIRERADTIEETLNATMGRTAHRIPGDIANIIQGYEGAEHLYFNVDPVLKKLVLSTTTPLQGGGSTYINSSDYEDFSKGFVYFIRLNGDFEYKYEGRLKYWPITASMLFVGETNMSEDQLETEFKNNIAPRYRPTLLNRINELIRGTGKEDKIELVGEMSIRAKIERKLGYPFQSENIFNRIIFEQIVDAGDL